MSASFGHAGAVIGLAVCGPLVCYLWWKEHRRWMARGKLRRQPGYATVGADEFRLTYDGFRWDSVDDTSTAWTDVRGAAALVEASPAGDALTVALRIAPGHFWIAFASDVDGFDLLRLALKDRFGVRPGWEEAVWRGPDGLNWRTLWGDAPPPGERCWKCQYDLRGNDSGVCPECGTVFVWPAPAKTTAIAKDDTDEHR
jgi:hypothetical protein